MLQTTSTPSVIHLDAKAVARRYGRSVRWVRGMVQSRAIPYMKIGGAVLFVEKSLDQWEQHYFKPAIPNQSQAA